MVEGLEHGLKIILNTVTEGAMLVDMEGRIIYYNQQMGNLEGLQPEKVIGKTVNTVYGVSDMESEHYHVRTTGVPIVDRFQEYYSHKRKNISTVGSTYPIIKNGEIIATYSVARSVNKVRELLKRTAQAEIGAYIDLSHNENNTRYSFDDIVTRSSSMADLIEKSKKFARYPSNIMIFGETGVGKEIIAQSIHNYNTVTRTQPFVGINCAAIPDSLLESTLFGSVRGAYTGAEDRKGLLEEAGNGTVYLDEINSMPLNLQSKLLRVLQEKCFRPVGGTKEIQLRCRIISSANTDIDECLKRHMIREDLYYRLSTHVVSIPALRSRKVDIPLLARYFAERYSVKYGLFSVTFSDEAMQILSAYDYPGNIRELENIIESALTLAGKDRVIHRECLPERLSKKAVYVDRASGTLKDCLRDAEIQRISDALENHDWNITQASVELGIARQNLQYRIKKLGIKKVKSHGKI